MLIRQFVQFVLMKSLAWKNVYLYDYYLPWEIPRLWIPGSEPKFDTKSPGNELLKNTHFELIRIRIQIIYVILGYPPDSQESHQYPWNLYLIHNVEDIVVFTGLKSLILIIPAYMFSCFLVSRVSLWIRPCQLCTEDPVEKRLNVFLSKNKF